MSYDLEYTNRKAFIKGQLDLYKNEFIETNNDKYLEVMSELNKLSVFLDNSKDFVYKVIEENIKLKEDYKILEDYNMTKDEFNHATTFNRGCKFKINDKEFQCVNLGYDNCISCKEKKQGWYILSLGDNGNTYFYSFSELYKKVKKYKSDNEHLIF